MKILKHMALLLLVSCGQAAFAFHNCSPMNLEGMRKTIPAANMPQLLKNRENLDKYKDCLEREQELTETVWTQNQNETIARRAAHASALQESLKAQEKRLHQEKNELLGGATLMIRRNNNASRE